MKRSFIFLFCLLIFSKVLHADNNESLNHYSHKGHMHKEFVKGEKFDINPERTKNIFYGIHGDWETRRVFSGFSLKRTENGYKNYTDKFIQLGFAPYLGNYGDLHSWIMIKSKKNSFSNSWSTYPLLKFFKGDFLFELGFNNKTQWDAHLMYRF